MGRGERSAASTYGKRKVEPDKKEKFKLEPHQLYLVAGEVVVLQIGRQELPTKQFCKECQIVVTKKSKKPQ